MRQRCLLIGLVAATLGACDNSDQKIAEIQRQADEKVAKIEQDAKERLASSERRVQELQVALSDAGAQVKAEADEEVSKAKTEGEKFAAEAAQALAKARAAYKDLERSQLAMVGKDADELKSKVASAPAKLKSQFEQPLKDIATKRGEMKKLLDDFDSAELDKLKTVKAAADKKIAEIKKLVHATRAKLPQS